MSSMEGMHLVAGIHQGALLPNGKGYNALPETGDHGGVNQLAGQG